jgi:hypothetical protein
LSLNAIEHECRLPCVAPPAFQPRHVIIHTHYRRCFMRRGCHFVVLFLICMLKKHYICHEDILVTHILCYKSAVREIQPQHEKSQRSVIHIHIPPFIPISRLQLTIAYHIAVSFPLH